jgi:anaerobic magnesium-protoporphyrin IX monomethyl ester cyclase
MKDSVLAIVSSSRGCSQLCSFCSQQLFWQRSWRGRSAENFIGELEHLREKYGVDVVMIADETPTLSRERWERILDLKMERGLDTKLLLETRVDDILRDEDIMWKYQKAGVDHIYVGVESPSQATLDIFKKNIKVEESRRALDLINEHGMVTETSFPDLAFFLAIAPWPYSEIYPDLKPYVESHDYSKYNLVEPVIKPKNMTLEEVSKELGLASMNFYMHKISNLDKMSSAKREFMIKVIKLIAEDSYLAKDMAEMPAAINKVLEQAGIAIT